MNLRHWPAFAAALVLIAVCSAQDSGSQGPQANPNGGRAGGGYGRRGGGFGGGMGMMGGGLSGTVTEVAGDHYTIKTEAGEVYTVRYSANTRIMKQGVGQGQREQNRGGEGQGSAGAGSDASQGMGALRRNPPQEIKASDVKTGDVIGVMSDPNEPVTNKTVGAVAVVVMDPQVVQQMHAMEANYGKTWLMGKVTAIDGTKITLDGAVDHTAHAVVADENTTFRKRRDPVTLADIQVGDTIRADGSVKDGVFVATTVNVGGQMGGGQGPAVPRSAPPQ